MNNNADLDFLRFLSRERFDLPLGEALGIMDEARRLYTPEPQREGVTWRGIYFSPEADEALTSPNGSLITAIKRVRDDNHAPGPTAYPYNYTASGTLGLRDAKDVCEARRSFLRGW